MMMFWQRFSKTISDHIFGSNSIGKIDVAAAYGLPSDTKYYIDVLRAGEEVESTGAWAVVMALFVLLPLFKYNRSPFVQDSPSQYL